MPVTRPLWKAGRSVSVDSCRLSLKGLFCSVNAVSARGDVRIDAIPLVAYDAQLNRWSTQAPAPITRYNLAAVAGSNGRIYFLGGSYRSNDLPVRPVDVFTISKSDVGH
jgi:hypothetical protein